MHLSNGMSVNVYQKKTILSFLQENITETFKNTLICTVSKYQLQRIEVLFSSWFRVILLAYMNDTIFN